MKKKSSPFKVEIEKIDIGGDRTADFEKAVNSKGQFIGDVKDATILWKKYGIEVFELRTKRSKVCSVGYNPKKKLWYGWSHRAISGFKTRAEAAKFAESVS